MALTRINNQALTNVTSAGLPSGTVLQVVQGTLGTTVTKSPPIDGTLDSGLSATITPSSTSSKILVQYSIFLGQAASYNAWTEIVRGSTVIGSGTAEGSHRPTGSSMVTGYAASGNDQYWVACAANSFIDSPATTSSTTYKIKIGSYSGAAVYVNRSATFQDNSNGYDTIPLSTITLTEIAG